MCKRGINNEGLNYKLYQMIRSYGGFDNFVMIELHKFPCESKRELYIEEDRVMKEMKATLNKLRSYTSEKERKENLKKWYDDNRDLRKIQTHNNYLANKEQ